MQHFPITEKLHTDILEEKYGPIHSTVIKHNDKIREALLADDKNIARTYALTFLSSKMPKEFKKINSEIKKGKPIGKVFREHGYIIRKNVLDVFIIALPGWLRKEFATEERFAKARLSEFYAKKEHASAQIYGIVTEVYTPDFRKPVVNEVDKAQTSVATQFLEKEGFSKDDIWQRIGNENNYDDVLARFTEAKELSYSFLVSLKQKVEKEIKAAR
ncbi:MAG: hypothetical protein WCK90_06175 [archaeon]